MPKPVLLPPPKLCALALAPLLLLAACRNETRSRASSSSSAPSPAPSASARHPTAEPLAKETRAIPAGTLRSGSTPGDAGRVPELEAKDLEVELGPFGIDRLPYPNDPSQAPLLGKSRDEARR